jgi:hypothetical protein
MKKPEHLDEQSINEFQEMLQSDISHLLYMLGASSVDQYTPPDVGLSYDYYRIGLRLWRAFQREMYSLICDAGQRKPKTWVNELIGGDIRNLATGIILAIHTEYGVSLAVAVPAAALIMKTGLLTYCERLPKPEPFESVQAVFDETKRMVEEDHKDDLKLLEEYFRVQATKERRKEPE